MRWHFHSPADAIFGQINRFTATATATAIATFNHNSRRQSVAPSKKVKCDRCKRGGAGQVTSIDVNGMDACVIRKRRWNGKFSSNASLEDTNWIIRTMQSHQKREIFLIIYLHADRCLVFSFLESDCQLADSRALSIIEPGNRYAHWYLRPYVIIDALISFR